MKKYIIIAALSLTAINANATTAEMDINLSSTDKDRLSDATLSIANSYKDIAGKISVKIDSASDGKNSKPKIDEAYISKSGFKLGKQGMKFGIADTNFNTLHSSTEKAQSKAGTGLSFEGTHNDINYSIFGSKKMSGVDINTNFEQGSINGNFGFSASKGGDKIFYVSAVSGKFSVLAQKTNEDLSLDDVSVTNTRIETGSIVWVSETKNIKANNALVEVSYQLRPNVKVSVNNKDMAAIKYTINKNIVLNTEFKKNSKSNLNVNIHF